MEDLTPKQLLNFDGLNDQELVGFAAQLAANELVKNWEQALKDGWSIDVLVKDIDELIAKLSNWKSHVVSTSAALNKPNRVNDATDAEVIDLPKNYLGEIGGELQVKVRDFRTPSGYINMGWREAKVTLEKQGNKF